MSFALVQHNSGEASAATISVTITATGANDLLHAMTFACGTTGTGSGAFVPGNMSETGGSDTWADAIGYGETLEPDGNSGAAASFYTVTAGSVTAVTWDNGTSGAAITLHVQEFSGNATTGVLDQTQAYSNGGTDTDIEASASITPSGANYLVVSGAITAGLGGENIAAGTNYTFLDFQSPADDSSSEYWIQTTATATAGDFTITGGHTAAGWLVGMCSFVVGSGAPVVTTTPGFMYLGFFGQG